MENHLLARALEQVLNVHVPQLTPLYVEEIVLVTTFRTTTNVSPAAIKQLILFKVIASVQNQFAFAEQTVETTLNVKQDTIMSRSKNMELVLLENSSS